MYYNAKLARFFRANLPKRNFKNVRFSESKYVEAYFRGNF